MIRNVFLFMIIITTTQHLGMSNVVHRPILINATYEAV